jgi:hypothetical protein
MFLIVVKNKWKVDKTHLHSIDQPPGTKLLIEKDCAIKNDIRNKKLIEIADCVPSQ